MNKKSTYTPPQKYLEKYAQVLVNFALGSGKGIKKGDTIAVFANEYSKPLYIEVLKAIWKSGGHVISKYEPINEPWFKFDKDFYEHAHDHQIDFFPEKYYKGLIDQIDHSLFIISDTDKKSLQGVDSQKIMRRSAARKPYMEWRNEKEAQGKFSWTLGLYGTPAMAKEAGLSEKEYWNQIIKSCFLDTENPIAVWKDLYKNLESYRKKLNKLKIQKVHIQGEDINLFVQLGSDRQWLGGRGANIPSFELFVSPDWRGTDGWVRFNQPLYVHGNLIEGIELWFEKGLIVKSKAKKNEKMLKSLIATKNADKIGEFSLTDKRFSKINKFMAETLYDENFGGKYGNTHIAIGAAYRDSHVGDIANVTKEEWEKLGFNDSSVHTDIISTSNRTVTAYLPNGKTKVIYKDGEFCI